MGVYFYDFFFFLTEDQNFVQGILNWTSSSETDEV